MPVKRNFTHSELFYSRETPFIIVLVCIRLYLHRARFPLCQSRMHALFLTVSVARLSPTISANLLVAAGHNVIKKNVTTKESSCCNIRYIERNLIIVCYGCYDFELSKVMILQCISHTIR